MGLLHIREQEMKSMKILIGNAKPGFRSLLPNSSSTAAHRIVFILTSSRVCSFSFMFHCSSLTSSTPRPRASRPQFGGSAFGPSSRTSDRSSQPPHLVAAFHQVDNRHSDFTQVSHPGDARLAFVVGTRLEVVCSTSRLSTDKHYNNLHWPH